MCIALVSQLLICNMWNHFKEEFIHWIFQSESQRNIFLGKSFRELGYTGQMAKVSQVKAILLGKNEIGW